MRCKGEVWKRKTISKALIPMLAVTMLCPSVGGISKAATNLNGLIDEAADGATVVLEEDYTGALTVGADKKITLDLNGHKVSAEGTGITNNGSLILKDSSANETGIVEVTGTTSNTWAIVNNGTLEVDSGNYTSTTTGNGIAWGIENKKDGKLTVKGGTIEATTTGNQYAIGLNNYGVVDKMEGGLILGDLANSSVGNNGLGAVNREGGDIFEISGGTIKGISKSTGYACGMRNEGSVGEIKGGTIEGYETGTGKGYGLYVAKGTVTKISGGKIHSYASGGGYTFGLWLASGTTVSTISGGECSSEVDNHFESGGNNGLGVSIDAGANVGTISGGVFVGKTIGDGHGYGLRNRGSIMSLNGGAFISYGGGHNGDMAEDNKPQQLYIDGGNTGYTNGYALSPISQGAPTRYVRKESGERYVQICEEDGDFVAAFVFDTKTGRVVKRYGDIRESYTVYSPDQSVKEPLVLKEADLEEYAEDATLFLSEGMPRPVFYFMGSSVTYGYGSHGCGLTEKVRDMFNVTTYKDTISGTNLAAPASFIQRKGSYVERTVNNLAKNARVDALVLQLSTNDANNTGTDLGEVTAKNVVDLDSFDISTTAGAMEYIIRYAQDTWGCPVVIYTNPRLWPDSYKISRYETMIDFCYQLQDKWGKDVVGVADYYNGQINGAFLDKSGFNPSSMMSDDIHPNSTGYDWMTPSFGELLMDYAAANQTKKLINEIGTVKNDAASKTAIDAAEVAYNKLTQAQKTILGKANTKVLTDAKTAYEEAGKPAPSVVKATAVTLSKAKAALTTGQSVSLAATVAPANATNKTVIWKSTNDKIAKVVAGKVTAVAPGTATISASVDGKTATCVVTVTPAAVKSLKVKKASKTSMKVTFKGAKGLSYKITYQKGKGKKKTITTTKTSVVIKKLSKKSTYNVQVVAFKKVSGKTYTSKKSKTVTLKLK
ncbi:MAG: Ig-like domain-containing protein [Lachnospiraceae bacterium]|nr:Ig-like domain-containing protein [Lachnospiraceae bacterium]